MGWGEYPCEQVLEKFEKRLPDNKAILGVLSPLFLEKNFFYPLKIVFVSTFVYSQQR